MINYQLDIKLEQFTEEELDTVLKKIKSRKAEGIDKIHPGFSFPSIYGPPYLTFQSHLVLLPSDVLALLLVETIYFYGMKLK